MAGKPTRVQLIAAVRAGAAARRDGALVTSCPWSVTKASERLLAAAWLRGYVRAGKR